MPDSKHINRTTLSRTGGRARRRPARIRVVLYIGGPIALVVAMIAATAIGAVAIPPVQQWNVLNHHIFGGPPADALADQIMWGIRFPRVLLAAITGAALSLAGVVFQSLVHNPLADPFVLGVSSGSSIGAVLVLTYGASSFAGIGGAAMGFVTALITTTIVYVLAQRSGRLTGGRLILAGVAVSYLATAVTSYLQLSAKPGQLQGIMFWLMGSLAGAQWNSIPVPVTVIVACTVWLLTRGRALNALIAGDDAAFGLGVNVFRLRIELLVVGSLLTATVVSVAGGIGFVGLIIPHITRLLVGGDHHRLLPVSTVVGAIFLILVDLASRTINPPNELPIGILTAAVGAPFFLFLMRRHRDAA